MHERDQINTFIDALASYDGFPPFSDAKLPIDPGSGRIVIVAEDDAILAVGASASHLQSDGSIHSALETAVQPVMRFSAFEGAVLDASLRLVAKSDSFSVWSRRSTLGEALVERGFVESRVLDFLVVDLPIHPINAPEVDERIRTYVAGDTQSLISVNRAAFAGHREAAGLDAEGMEALRSEAWFDGDGIFLAENEGVDGFCWTKVHPNGDGEIFRIAVAPTDQGSGIGAALLHAGFRYLAGRSDVLRGVLWVDRANAHAVRLYRSFGMERERSNSEFIPG